MDKYSHTNHIASLDSNYLKSEIKLNFFRVVEINCICFMLSCNKFLQTVWIKLTPILPSLSSVDQKSWWGQMGSLLMFPKAEVKMSARVYFYLEAYLEESTSKLIWVVGRI